MKLAIVKLSALGDIVHAAVALQFLKAHSPELCIDWLVEQRFAGLLAGNSHIDHILTVNLKGLKTHKRAIFQQIGQVRRYAKADYDVVIDAQGLIKSALTARLLGKRVLGFDKNSIRESIAARFYNQTVACAYAENTIVRNIKVLTAPLGIEVSHEQILNKQAFLFSQAVDAPLAAFFSTSQRNIVLVISSTWASRNYPIEKFAQVANSLQENCLVVWGNAAEYAQALQLARLSAYVQVLPALDLNALKAVIGQADLLIGNDTGPTHIAWAMNRASITLFGCTPVSRVYQTDINKVLKSPSQVNPYRLNKHDYSIAQLDSTVIVAMARDLLAR